MRIPCNRRRARVRDRVKVRVNTTVRVRVRVRVNSTVRVKVRVRVMYHLCNFVQEGARSSPFLVTHGLLDLISETETKKKGQRQRQNRETKDNTKGQM